MTTSEHPETNEFELTGMWVRKNIRRPDGRVVCIAVELAVPVGDQSEEYTDLRESVEA